MQPASPDRVAQLEERVAALTARVHELEVAAGARRAASVVAPPAKLAAPQREGLESKLGTYWLSRVGIVSLISGLALLIITYFGSLGPVLRVALGYAMAGALAWGGLRIARKHATFGRVVFAGGLAIGYFVTYALHFVPAMQIVGSEIAGVVLVAAAIGGIVATAHRMKSETVAGVALFLGLHTGLLSEVTALSLAVSTLLAAGAAFFLVANQWVIVPISTVVAVYTTHATLALHGGATPELTLVFLALDFVLFAGASLIRSASRAPSVIAIALLNWAGALGIGAWSAVHLAHGTQFALLVAFAAAHALLALVARLRRGPRSVVAVLISLALGTAALALPIEISGVPLEVGWFALAVLAAAVARRSGAIGLAWVAFAIGVGAQAYVAGDGALGLAAAPQVGCVLALLAIERVHAPSAKASVLRVLLVVTVALALMQLALVAFAPAMHSIAWVGAAFLLFAAGFALRDAAYRWTGFGVLGVAALRFLAVDLRGLSAGERVLTFVGGGAVLLAISFLYTRRLAARSARRAGAS